MKKINNISNIILLLLTTAITYLLFWPVPIEPTAWESPKDSRMDPIFSLNQKLQDIKIFWIDDGYVGTPEYLLRNGDFFLKLLAHIPQEANLDSKFKSVTKLQLSYTRISDVTPLKGFTQLTWLDLSGNQIGDVTPLKDLTQLTELDLGGNPINDVTPL